MVKVPDQELSATRATRASGASFRTLLLPLSTMSSNNTTRPVVFMDINIGETPAGRLKMELFSDIVPKYDPLIVSCSKH